MSYLAPEIVGGGRPHAGDRISSRAARCCGRRSSAASCSTARPTTRRTAGCATAWCSRCVRCAPTCRAPFVADHPARAVARSADAAVPVDARDGAADRHHAQEGPAAQGPPHGARAHRRRGAPGHGPRPAHGRSVERHADRADRRRQHAAHRSRAERVAPHAGAADHVAGRDGEAARASSPPAVLRPQAKPRSSPCRRPS